MVVFMVVVGVLMMPTMIMMIMMALGVVVCVTPQRCFTQMQNDGVGVAVLCSIRARWYFKTGIAHISTMIQLGNCTGCGPGLCSIRGGWGVPILRHNLHNM